MRDNLFPPPRFIVSKDPATAPAAARVHQICNKAVWRSLGFGGRIYGALLVLLWPLTATAAALPWLRRNGAAIRAMTGKSRLRQFIEILGLALRHRISPRYYYMFEFYLPERMTQAGDYLMRYETKQIAYRLLYPKVQTTGTPIKNKIAFAGYCRDHDLPALPLIAAFKDGARVADLGEPVLPERDLFAKRVLGKGGVGAERWNWIGNGLYRSTRGDELTGPALLDRVAALSKNQPYLVQPAVVNHAALRELSVGALCTVRLLTCRDDKGGFEATNASFRMSINPKSAVDNIHAGGIAATVDLATGRLGAASDLGLGPKFAWYDAHPLTGAAITGRVLPFWPEAMALATRAHAAFAEWTVIGWDIAILDDGARLIEGNKGPDVDLIQRPLRGPIGSGRFGELLAYNLERVRAP
jgi:hypothetical protein